MTLPDLTTLDTEAVIAARAELEQRLAERYPTTELTRGTVHDLILDPQAALSTAFQQQIDEQIRSASLLEIDTDPALADPILMDRLLSNWQISRKAGAQASGNVRFIINQQIPLTIAAGLILEADGVQFTTEAAYAIRISAASAEDDTDRVMQAVGDGTYAFTVPVIAVEAGAAGQIRKNTKLVPTTNVNYFVTAYADEDFGGGRNEETNAELRARQKEGVAARGWGNVYNLSALLHSQPEFADHPGYSIIGCGYTEMKRDAHNIQGISTGGKIDIYARTESLPTRVTLTKTCTYLGSTADGALWRFSLNRDEAPGFYDFAGVVDPSAENPIAHAVVNDSRSLDFSGYDHYPDIEDLEEGAYTRYQTGVFDFLDTQIASDTLIAGDTRSYDVTVRRMGQIDDLQDFVDDQDHGEFAGDALVRAPIPCDVRVEVGLVLARGQTSPDLAVLADDLATYVNSLDFTGLLYATPLQSILQSYLEKPAGVTQLRLIGTIRLPDGTKKYISGTEKLAIPDDLSVTCSGRTTAFFLDPADVLLSVTTGKFK